MEFGMVSPVPSFSVCFISEMDVGPLFNYCRIGDTMIIFPEPFEVPVDLSGLFLFYYLLDSEKIK